MIGTEGTSATATAELVDAARRCVVLADAVAPPSAHLDGWSSVASRQYTDDVERLQLLLRELRSFLRGLLAAVEQQ